MVFSMHRYYVCVCGTEGCENKGTPKVETKRIELCPACGKPWEITEKGGKLPQKPYHSGIRSF
jgi:hypothetical protein